MLYDTYRSHLHLREFVTSKMSSMIKSQDRRALCNSGTSALRLRVKEKFMTQKCEKESSGSVLALGAAEVQNCPSGAH